ncbi:phosphotransferase [Cyanothece sp. BG0011]|uniref:phosphotransferase n=1 Tax=Cyanothece sp. BG0011 TaxID=2082950 RepID=UPI000D1E919E|nr:phosphotransferase [Cyanothece sp. BG0011]
MNIQVNDSFKLLSDPNLSFLKDALSPNKVESIFNNYFPELIKNNTLSSIKVVRYKAKKRCLIEYQFKGEKEFSLLGKVRFKGTDTKSYYLQKYLWQNGFDDYSLDTVSVPQPIGVIPQWKMWLQRKVPGYTTTLLLGKPDGVTIAEKIAYAAYKLHQFPAKTDRYHTIDNELHILYEKLPLVSELYPHLKHRIREILKECDRLGKSLSYIPSLGIHRDFYADQIIINHSRLYLLDLDLYCYGDPSLDIGNFIAHITEYSLRVLGDFQALKDREIALQEAFIQLTGEESRKSIMIYKFLTLVRHIYISTQIKERNAYTEDLIRLCESYLETEMI